MDVRMPDGTIIQNVPEGTTQEDLQGRLNASRAPKTPEPPKDQWDVVKDRVSRIGTGMMDPVVGAAQIMERTGVPGAIRKGLGIEGDMEGYVKQRDAEYKAPEGVDWARMAGNVASPMNLLTGGTGMSGAVGSGALQAALAPTDAGDDTGTFLLKKAGQAALGGGLGGVLHAATRGVMAPTREATELMDQGVYLTPGQATGNRAVNAMEQKLTSVPVAGEVIQNAQRRGVEDVQGRVVNRAFGLGAETPLPAGRNSGEVIRNANQAASALYDAAVPHLRANPEGIMDAAAAYNRAVQNPQLTPDAVRTLQGLWDNNFANYAALDGQGLKALDSELGKLARDYSGHMASPSDRALSGALVDIKLALRGGLEQGMAPEHVHLLRTANRAYRNLIPVNKAASTRADRLATPRALEKAMAKQAGTDVTRTADDPLISRAVELTTPTVADSQTAGRAAMQSIPHLLSGLVAGLPAAALYSRTGTNLALGRTELQRLLAPYSDRVRTAIIAALRQ